MIAATFHGLLFLGLFGWLLRRRGFLVLDRGLGGGEAGDRHAVGRARHIVEAELVAELHRVRITTVFAADAELDVRAQFQFVWEIERLVLLAIFGERLNLSQLIQCSYGCASNIHHYLLHLIYAPRLASGID